MNKRLIAVLAAALAVLGCRKGPQVQPGLEFTAELPATRTGWTGETLEWTAGDAISMAYTVDGVWAGSDLYPSVPLSQGGPVAHFSVPGDFPTGGSGVHRFYALFPAASETDFDGDFCTSLPPIQTPTATSFDPAADLMAGMSAGYDAFPDGPVPLRWKRIAAHGDITLTGLGISADETVQSIVLQGQNGAELTGDIVIDPACPEDYATDGIPRVTVLADHLGIDASGDLRFWISIFPVDLTALTVTVNTDKAAYHKTFSGIDKSFLQNARNILRINMAGASRTPFAPVGENYVKVTEAPTDWTGDYLIVYEGNKNVLDGDGDKKKHATVTITDGKIPYADAGAYNIHIQKSGNGYSMKQGDDYFGLDKSENALNVSSAEPSGDSYRWTFTTVKGVLRAYNLGYSSRFLQFNASSNQFRCYTSAQKDVSFFRLDGAPSGGGSPGTPGVTTGSATSVSQSGATLSATFTGAPTYGGFQYGLSADELGEDWQAPFLGAGSFEVTLEGLGAGHTYYYRAYVGVLEGSTYRFYYGEVRTFTTPSGEIVIDGDQPGWYETPLMDITRSGKYLVNSSDPSLYYAIHLCAGGEKGPGGKTARNYTVCFSGEHHCPLWIAAPRHSMYVGGATRTDAYRQDPDIPGNLQYNSTKTGGGCNKGHMLGSAERTSSTATNRDVFYYTNIAPQLSANFNTGGGRWNVLEDYVDTQVCADTLYEVLGCYFDKYTDAYGATQNPSTISYGGRNDVSMPTMFYYVLLRTKKGNSHKALKDCAPEELKCAAFVRSHVNVRQAVSAREMMSVADLERITGVTYFPNVPNAPKNSFNASDWGL